MTKFKTYANKFTTLSDFEMKSNELGKQGWQLFSFEFVEVQGHYVAVWTAAYQDSIDSYGRYDAKQVIV